MSPPKALSAVASTFSAAGKRQASSRCMPGYWAPWPGNSTATLAGAAEEKQIPSGVVQAAAFCVSRFESAVSMVFFQSCENSSTKARRAWAEGLKAARERMAAARMPSQSRVFQPFSSRFMASELSPERTASCASPSQSGCCFSAEYSSSMAWKLDPPKPSALTAARRGWLFFTQGRSSVLR